MKRKLSDLKENECIKVNTLKQAKYFVKNANWIANAPTAIELKGNYLIRAEKGVIAWDDNTEGMKYVSPASDFIKPKKSKLKKVWQEIARMDGRITDLEADKTKPDLFLGLECETKELTELPEKWCVEHSESALSWIRENAEVCGHNISKRRYYMFPCNSCGNNSSDKTPEGYTLISQSDFERLVLNKPKEIIQGKEIDWSMSGQLLSSENGKVVLLYDGKHDKHTFNGTVIKGDVGGVGMYINKAYKHCYIKFNGSICLKN